MFEGHFRRTDYNQPTKSKKEVLEEFYSKFKC